MATSSITNAAYGSPDFQRYYNTVPQFAQAWDSYAAQVTAEGNSNALTIASDTFFSTFTQITKANPGLLNDVSTVAQTTHDFMQASSTVYGAVQTANGLLTAIKNDDGSYESTQATIAAINAVVGTTVTIVAATAPATYGVGALIAAAIAITFELLDLFGAFGKPTPPPVTAICGNNLSYRPPIVVGCTWCSGPNLDPNVVSVKPGAEGWRAFPGKGSPWFSKTLSSAQGIATFQWVSLGWKSPIYLYSIDSSGKSQLTSTGPQQSRPIDAAFPQYAWLEQDPVTATSPFFQLPQVGQFRQAFFAAWRGAKASAFNGSPVLDDADILLTALQVWNTAHSSETYHDLVADDLFIDPNNADSAAIRAYGPSSGIANPTFNLAWHANTNRPGYLGNGVIRINMGPQHAPPATAGAVKTVSLRLRGAATELATSASSTSTTKKVAAYTGIVVGSAALGIGAWSLATHQGFFTVLKGLWHSTGGKLIAKVNPLPALAGASESSRDKTNIQSLLFPRDHFSTSKAERWARSHGYSVPKVHITDEYIRIRQQPPFRFKKGSFRTISLGDSGVKAVVGHLR